MGLTHSTVAATAAASLALLLLALVVRTLLKTRDSSSVNCGMHSSLTLYDVRTLPDTTPFTYIPVWMYWDDDVIPQLALHCFDNWNRQCAASRFPLKPILVTQSTLHQYLFKTEHPCLDDNNDTYRALRSDIVRLLLLKYYGGVYMDATVIATQSFDWLSPADGSGFQMFQAMYNPKNTTEGCDAPVIETSFMVAPPHHKLVTAWLEELDQLWSCDRRVMLSVFRDVPKQKNLFAVYHVSYHALTKLLKTKGLKHFSPYKLHNCIQLRYLNFTHNTPHALVHAGERIKHGPLLKLIKQERQVIESFMLEGKIHATSFLGKFLALHSKNTSTPPQTEHDAAPTTNLPSSYGVTYASEDHHPEHPSRLVTAESSDAGATAPPTTTWTSLEADYNSASFCAPSKLCASEYWATTLNANNPAS